MKTAGIAAISAGVAVVAFILVFVGIGSNQAEKPIDYQKTLEETISTKSNSSQPSAPEEQTDYQRELEESVSSESISPSQPSAPEEQKQSQSIQEETPLPTMTPQPPVPVQPTPSEENCDKSYPDVCIPPYPPDLDCGEISYSNFEVLQPDPHRFDGDKDGIGCES